MHTLLQFCVLRDWLTKNPMLALKKPTADGVVPTSYFTREEFDKIIDATRAYDFGGGNACAHQQDQSPEAISAMFAWSGLSIMDAVTMERQRLNDNDCVFLYRAKTGVPANVPVPPDVAELLRSLPNSNPRYFFWSGNGDKRSVVKVFFRPTYFAFMLVPPAALIYKRVRILINSRERLMSTRNALRALLCTLILSVISPSVWAAEPPQPLNVKNGIDVLEARNFAVLRGHKKIGLITNHTGVDAQGRRTIDLLANIPGVELAAIFSPEHGAVGKMETTNIGNTVDAATRIPIYSVFGPTKESRHPPMDIVKTLDAIVYDIQDIGVRFYTYETTLGYFLEAAGKTGAEVIVLDRPNPIGGLAVEGPVLDPELESFVAFHAEPVRHGMTVGELARMWNTERKINAKLTVVQMENWKRGQWFDATGQLWINQSPNIRSLAAAILYPGTCLVEGTNVSVGRGTDKPFEMIGAPWIKAKELSDYLNRRDIRGVRFVPVNFTPKSSWYRDKEVGGIYIMLLDRDVLDAPQLGIEIASAIHRLYPKEFDISDISELVGDMDTVNAIKAGTDPRKIAKMWRPELEQFNETRKKYLIY